MIDLVWMNLLFLLIIYKTVSSFLGTFSQSQSQSKARIWFSLISLNSSVTLSLPWLEALVVIYFSFLGSASQIISSQDTSSIMGAELACKFYWSRCLHINHHGNIWWPSICASVVLHSITLKILLVEKRLTWVYFLCICEPNSYSTVKVRKKEDKLIWILLFGAQVVWNINICKHYP